MTNSTFTRDLTIGSQGTDVTALQKFLISLSYLGSAYNTGYFGSLTQRALIKFQAANGISPAVGYFGPKTRAEVNGQENTATPTLTTPNATSVSTSINFTRDLTIGSQGNDVKALQQYLNAHGFTVASSGNGSPLHETTYFGVATQAALIKFQKENNITPVAGYFGPITSAYVSAHQ
jgi:peptidoglycan hydrolase-like protein with peptidoglycan-binding domain